MSDTDTHRADSTEQGKTYWRYKCGTCRAEVILRRRRVDLFEWNRTPHKRCVPVIVWGALNVTNDRTKWSEVFNIVRGAGFQKWIAEAK